MTLLPRLSPHSLTPPRISCRTENHFLSRAAHQKNMVYLRRKRALTPARDTGSGPDDALSVGQHRLTRATKTSPSESPASAQSPSKSPHPQSPYDGLKAPVTLTSLACLSCFSPDLTPRLPWPGTYLPQHPSDLCPARPALTPHVKAQARPDPQQFYLSSVALSPLGGYTATSSPCLLCLSVFHQNVHPTEHRLLSGFPLMNTQETLLNKRTPQKEACDGKRACHGQHGLGNLHSCPARASPAICQTQLFTS